MIRYKCNKCGAAMESPDSMIGKMETCPACNRRMKVLDPVVVKERDRLRQMQSTTFVCAVSGVSKDGRQEIVANCEEGEPIFLQREPDNRYDRNAIAVYVERKSFFGRRKYLQVGYIPEEDAEEIAEAMDSGSLAGGAILYVVGGQEGKYYGLRIVVAIGDTEGELTIDVDGFRVKDVRRAESDELSGEANG